MDNTFLGNPSMCDVFATTMHVFMLHSVFVPVFVRLHTCFRYSRHTLHEQTDKDTRAHQHMQIVSLDKYMHSRGPRLGLPLPSGG